MTQAEAKMRILAEWRTWIGHQRATGFNSTAEALVFVGEIQQINLICFRSRVLMRTNGGW
jgi:hypothetical protein